MSVHFVLPTPDRSRRGGEIDVLAVAAVAVLLLIFAAGCRDTTPPPKPPSTPPTGVTLIGPCLPKCGNVEQR